MRLERLDHPKLALTSQEASPSKRLVELLTRSIWKVITRIRVQKLLDKLKNPNATTQQPFKPQKVQLPLTFLTNRTLERDPVSFNGEIKLFKSSLKLSTGLKETLPVPSDYINSKSIDYSTTIQWKFKTKTKTKTDLLDNGISRFLQPISRF